MVDTITFSADDTITQRAKKLVEVAFLGLVKNATTVDLMGTASFNVAAALEHYQQLDGDYVMRHRNDNG